MHFQVHKMAWNQEFIAECDVWKVEKNNQKLTNQNTGFACAA